MLLQRGLQVHGNGLAAHELRMHVAVIHGHLVGSALSGRSNGKVQALKKLVHISCMARIGTETDLCGTQAVHAAYLPYILKTSQYLIRQIGSLAFAVLLQDDDELDAYVAVYVTFGHLSQVSLYLGEQLFTVFVTEGLIQAFEVLQIKFQDNTLGRGGA